MASSGIPSLSAMLPMRSSSADWAISMSESTCYSFAARVAATSAGKTAETSPTMA